MITGPLPMITGPLSAIRALPERMLHDLAAALAGGRFCGPVSPFALRNAIPGFDEAAAAELSSLLASGLTVQHAALLLEALAAQRAEQRAAVIELVTSGPDMIGATRDTGAVLRELFAGAERRVLLVGFAVHQGREVFASLAIRMCERPDLAVRLCLDVRRTTGDTTRTDALLRRFAGRFVHHEWPGPRLPEIFYDPRSLVADADGQRAALHAKCVVVDGLRAFVGSANFTEAAQLRNLEIGIMTADASIAGAVEGHIEALIQHGYLRRLSLLAPGERIPR
ncbi:MAG TPA: DISARM system phospholipase D-like protein DrmC [Stellaceae bacterium]|nr:DISARM system phospholipase D-like protein DrmC [Stellaceae bacterium]